MRTLDSLAERTIRSQTKIADFPFFVGTYYADYELDRFTDGSIRSVSDMPAFFSTLYANLGYPATIDPRRVEPLPGDAVGCSAFAGNSPDGSRVVGKNLDWRWDPILLLRTTPPNGYRSLTIVDLSLCDIFGLGRSPYALLTAPYVPFDGMNERGLTVSILSVQSAAEYPTSPGKMPVGDFNIVRILLDRCATVDEAIATFGKYQIVQSGPLPVHYLISDLHDHCIVELCCGETHVLRPERYACVTNFLHACKPERETTEDLCERYRLMERFLQTGSGVFSIERAKELLSQVAVFQDGYSLPSTIWSVVFTPDDSTVRIRIGAVGPYYRVRL